MRGREIGIERERKREMERETVRGRKTLYRERKRAILRRQ